MALILAALESTSLFALTFKQQHRMKQELLQNFTFPLDFLWCIMDTPKLIQDLLDSLSKYEELV